MPRRSRRLNPPCLLDGLSDDLVLRVFSRAPFMTHGSLHVVCRRLKTLLRSPEFLQQRVDSGLAEHGVLSAGGVRDGEAFADCLLLSNGEWWRIQPMSGPRWGACSVIIDNEMWVIGGMDENDDELPTVEVYSPNTNSWRSCTPMSQRRGGAVAGVVGGRLVVAGGWCDGVGMLTSVEAYTGTGWTSLPPMPHEAAMATARVLNGRLYVIGGAHSNKLQVLEKTEENGFAWTVKADLPAARWAMASVVHERKIMVMGGKMEGQASGTYSVSVVVYDPEEDAWATAFPLPRPINIDPGGMHMQMNSNGEVLILRRGRYAQSLLRRDRHTSQWVEDTGVRIEHAPSGEPGALLLG